MEQGKLNVDIAKAISELEAMLKEFRLKIPLYKMFFRGKGLEFDGYRDFYPDDDAERIDWKASSRARKLLVKQYIEERDIRVMFIIDVGENMVFGSTERIKCEFVTELVAAFSKVMLNVNDRIGFIFFSDAITHFVDCKSGERQFNIFIETLSDGKNYGGTTDLDLALDFAVDYLDDSISSVILVSDFLNISAQTEKKLGLLSHRFETIAIRVRDPLDMTLPDIEGEVILEDPKTHHQVIINPKVAKMSYEKYAYMQGRMVKEMFEKSELDHVDLTTDKSFAEPLTLFLKERLEGL
ncbi:MAG: DUF58 domain-containing protein [Candidatus Pacearchaeota archaeon]|jgi:uncharacterized protein (DUF58 family)